MDFQKDIRPQQRFDNFKKSYQLLEKYSSLELTSEIEKAGLIQFFEITFDLALKVLKDYLEAQGYIVKSPRETIKQAYQMEIIDEGHAWIEALSSRNQTTHTYDEQFTEKFVQQIQEVYFPLFKSLYEKLLEEY
ncbi:nucleotidyltransferase substrate binding protein [Caldibacillus thermoamylovorans]|uniref:nucleotidyltransferase substrate binding protein n=1 Tax=Caldibacillus thermoamylovorans TaxID=35841 RepID=UPI001D06B03C|nr:nucleotidyltransferase substrate binding protein [Caldibacillus thermoamylovorans]MCB5936926.1 nucleotidyltransferase substrate binding protein [Bacillus sp. DFI.2.34]MCB7078747.1 nucleotidyltransferase substrate binding protein [Caldibacillus thermoamylovorans]